MKDYRELERKLYPFQNRAVAFHLAHHYSINGCKMGLGKTIQAIALLSRVDGPACIVCPAYLRKNWHVEIDKFLPKDHLHPITVLSYEKFRRFPPPFCSILIFDEAHYLKNMLSLRTKFTHKYVQNILPKYLLLLSGTPIKNRVTDFYSLMKLCSYNPKSTSGLPLKKGFSAFADALCDSATINTPHGTVKKYSGLKNRPLLIKYLRGKYFSAKNDVPLPELNRQTITVDHIKNKALAEQLEQDFAENHISTAKKNIAVEKAVFTVKYLKDCVENGETPILVFSDHVDSCRSIRDQLSVVGIKNVVVITGSTPPDERNRLVDLFQQQKIDVLVCTIGSMSTGFTLTATNRVVFNDLSWCPADNEQAEKRIHRIGQTKNCYVVHLVAQGIDTKISQVLQEKQKTINKLYSN